MSIGEIKRLMKDGKIAETDAATKELSEREPNNLQAKMLYGTCRQLLGDEETFRRIHDELTPEMEQKDGQEAEETSLWKKYHALWMSLIVGGLVLVGIVISKNQLIAAEDVNKLAEAEQLFVDGKFDETSRSLDGINLTATSNVKRLQAPKGKIGESTEGLKEKREREVNVKGFLEKVQLAYTPEGLLGGSARDCIQCYYGAVANGYVLNDEDRGRIKHCYDVGLSDLRKQRKAVDDQIIRSIRPFRNPQDIDNYTQQLNEWYNALRK